MLFILRFGALSVTTHIQSLAASHAQGRLLVIAENMESMLPRMGFCLEGYLHRADNLCTENLLVVVYHESTTDPWVHGTAVTEYVARC
ncbi:hypothetical protein DL98DRAFT_318220 [Cadophora sp. DSE1049]|nr:hypothetical protein DL98DRAFT_318220 [Cadophora sp. DSE1049]